LLDFMIRSASGEGLVPEQVWEDPNLAASPYGSDPTTASIGFVDGQAAGSASPLTWAQSQELRLIVDLGTGHDVDTPQLTTARYVAHPAPTAATVTLTSPTSGSTIEGGSTTVSGTTTPGAAVSIETQDTDTAAAATTVSTKADPTTGAFSATVSIGFGTNTISVSSTSGAGHSGAGDAQSTGFAQTQVVGDVVGGTTVLDVTHTGNHDGPGTYQYPTAPDFVAGSFDIDRFQVITSNGEVYLRLTLADLTPTFGATMGAQLLDYYVHDPAAASTSTAAAYTGRNYTIAPADAWSQLIEVQGFASPVWQNATGGAVGTPTAVVASTLTNTITVALPESAFGTPGPGWTFTLALTGQDGFSSDEARAFTATAGAYSFGVCASGNTEPICSVDPTTVPQVMDTLTPPGVSQATELNPTLGPVVLEGVTAP
jgi:glucoamylase